MPEFETPNQPDRTKRKADVAISPLDNPAKLINIDQELAMASDDETIDISEETKKYIEFAIKRAMVAIKDEYEEKLLDLENNNKALTLKVENLEEKMEALEKENDALEQYSRRNNIRISGVTEAEGEDMNDLTEKIKDLAKKGNITIKPDDIDRAHRVGVKRDILVKFVRYSTKSAIMEKKQEIHIKDPDVYMAEDMTHYRSSILYEARKIRKQDKGHIKHVWTSDGKIIIRDKRNRKRKVYRLSDLDTYRPAP